MNDIEKLRLYFENGSSFGKGVVPKILDEDLRNDMEAVFAVSENVFHRGKNSIYIIQLKLVLVDQVDDIKQSWLENKLIFSLENC